MPNQCVVFFDESVKIFFKFYELNGNRKNIQIKLKIYTLSQLFKVVPSRISLSTLEIFRVPFIDSVMQNHGMLNSILVFDNGIFTRSGQ